MDEEDLTRTRSGTDNVSRGASGSAPGEHPRWGPGARVGRYVLVRPLGEGGMGAVFIARHVDTDGEQALKLLPIEEGINEGALERFRREGQAQAASGAHENVLRVHACGEEGGHAFLAMELARGGDLKTRLKSGPLEPRFAAQLVRDLARGLAHVHAHGVLHRDLKPGNVVFDEHGTPKLMDFGLASLTGAEKLTKTGTMLGTPAYMAPEQAGGEPLDARADVYALGAVLFHCLTGRAPFEGDSMFVLVRRVLMEPPLTPSTLNQEVPPELDDLVLRTLSKSKDERPQSAQALADELERFLQGQLEATRRTPRGLVVLAAAVGVIALGLVVAALARRPAPAPALAPPAAIETSTPARVEPTGPLVVTIDELPANTHRPTARLRATLSADATTVEVHAGDAIARLSSGDLVAGYDVPLAFGETLVSVVVPGRGKAARTVRRFRVPPWLEPGVEPTEVVARDGSILVYHPPGSFEMGWNGLLDTKAALENDYERLIFGAVYEAAARTPPDALDLREREVVLLYRGTNDDGSPESDEAALRNRLRNESPRHEETLREGFFLGKHEVTWDQLRRFGPGSPPEARIPGRAFVPGLDTPVFNVTWDEAKAYCEAQGLRLPSEVEWEYAARGGDERRLFPFGNAFPEGAPDLANVRGLADGFEFTSPVGSFPRGASRWGCLDLAGNVYEWTADEKYRYTAEPGFDPRANTDPRRDADLLLGSGRPKNLFEVHERDEPDELRTQQRGGSWDREIGRTRSGFRVTAMRGARESVTGFRVACDAVP